jgi:hypothetical protein
MKTLITRREGASRNLIGPLLSVLNKEHHEESDDSRACVYD